VRRLTSSVAVTTLIAGFSPCAAHAQSVAPQCTSTVIAVRDGCQKAVDVFQFLAPQLGTLIAGGNATLGQGGALGAGHVAIGLRATAIRARLPRVDQITPSITGARSDDYEIKDQFAPLPSLDVAVGVFNGFSLGVTNVLAIDVLGSVTMMKSFSGDNLELKTEGGAFHVDFGGRVGLLQESIVTPGIAVSYLRRQLPVIDIIGSSGNDRLQVRGVEAKSDSWRITAGKNLLLFSLAVGAGQDRSSAQTSVEAQINRGGVSFDSGPIFQKQTLTRTNYFADVSFNIPFVRIVGEIGRASGGGVAATYNTFGGKSPNDALTYASVGLRLGF
jgi:hypothetical protein